MDLPWWLGVLGVLLVGALVGAWQGYWVAFVGIPAFIVTLAGMLIFRGATMVTLGNTQISPFPDTFRNIASGYANGIFGGQGYALFTLVLAAAGVAAFAFTQFRERERRHAGRREHQGEQVVALPAENPVGVSRCDVAEGVRERRDLRVAEGHHRGAAEDEHAGESHDERRDADERHPVPLPGAHERPDEQHAQDAEPPRQVHPDDEHARDGAREGHHRADRQVDVTADDHDDHADRKDCLLYTSPSP